MNAKTSGATGWLSVGAVCLAVLAGCTGSEGATLDTTIAPTTTLPAPVTVPPPDPTIAGSFFSTLASRTPLTTTEALQFAVPDSAAANYVLHQAALLRLLDPAEPASTTPTANGYSVCAADAPCVEYTNVVADPASGLVSEFSINGVPLAGRVIVGGAPVEFEGGTVSVSSAYRSNADELTVIMTITNNSNVELTPFGFAATYQPVGALASIETNGARGPQTVAAGTTAELLLLFSDRPFGDSALTNTNFDGRIRFGALRADGIDVTFDVAVTSN